MPTTTDILISSPLSLFCELLSFAVSFSFRKQLYLSLSTMVINSWCIKNSKGFWCFVKRSGAQRDNIRESNHTTQCALDGKFTVRIGRRACYNDILLNVVHYYIFILTVSCPSRAWRSSNRDFCKSNASTNCKTSKLSLLIFSQEREQLSPETKLWLLDALNKTQKYNTTIHPSKPFHEQGIKSLFLGCCCIHNPII